MIKARAWPVKAMYILIAAALAISLVIIAAPALKVSANPGLSEWDRVTTPTTDGWVLAPESTIIDYALADGGEVAYAVVYAYDEDPGDDVDVTGAPDPWTSDDYRLLKSDDGAATWEDLTDTLTDQLTDDGYTLDEILQVATDWEDPDFVAVALTVASGVVTFTPVHVYISTDGGVTFTDTGEVAGGGVFLAGPNFGVSDLAVSYEDDGEREIAIGGQDNYSDAALFRCTVTGDNPGPWKDATDWAGDYQGWDDDETGDFSGNPSVLVTDIIFSTSWETDRTILAVTVLDLGGSSPGGYLYGTVYLQSGVWGETSAAWNEYADFAEAVPVKENVHIPMWLMNYDARSIAGIALPMDYEGNDTDMRYAWVWVNYFDGSDSVGEILRVRDDAVDPVDTQISKTPWLTNVSYLGYKAEGKAIAGLLADSAPYALYESDLMKECCEGVQVYRNAGITSMEICCLEWDKACKPPTGRFSMAVSYVSDDKAYAVALFGVFDYDEGAWSVSFDDGDTWNQLSLVDTYIDYLSDVAVSPDCNKTMLVSIHEGEKNGGCYCDSVWLHAENLPEAEEYSGQWLRTWCGDLEYDWGLLRLAPEETTGDNVYLVDYDTNTIYYNDLETLACWDRGTATVDEIVDLAVKDESTIYALGYDGDVAMSDDHGGALTWTTPVDSEVTHGYTIAVWGDHILVGGEDGDVSYSDDGGETFTALEDVATSGYVTVAFDTYFDTNDVIYAALDSAPGTENGIYQWVIGESTSWMDLKAEPLESQIGVSDGDPYDERVEVNFTGLVVDRPGNPFTSAENGGVIYASYYGYVTTNVTDVWFTGVARSLERIVEVCTTCLTWDFLHVGLTVDVEGFEVWPDALKICGCLTPDSNSKLFAIDEWWDYDMDEGLTGSVWTYEDCYAKKAPDIASPDDGAVIPADPCSCYSIPFTVLWDTLCDACSYDIAFALDEDFTMPVRVNGEEGFAYHVVGDVPSYSIMGGEAGGLSCETTYYVRVRAADAATGEIIHSWWSDPIEITVAPSVEAGIITLVAPEPNAQGTPIKKVGFSWDLMADADAFDWVLDDNFDFSSPVESKDGLTSTAYECTKTLEHGTTYYWQVTAYNEGAVISMSAVGTFTTGATGAFCCPQDGMCFDTQAELEAYNAEHYPAQPATPFWVWVIIGIGAVLVIVVIVLIFRTRRV